jgi:hypothetical protein
MPLNYCRNEPEISRKFSTNFDDISALHVSLAFFRPEWWHNVYLRHPCGDEF